LIAEEESLTEEDKAPKRQETFGNWLSKDESFKVKA
jgi:hypothetical protein